MEVIYEDNHLIAVNKTCREIVQGDKTGDTPLSEILKAWLKEKYAKPGNVFVGVAHRLDRPVSGLVLFAKTSKALARLNEMFRTGDIKKTYWAIVKNGEFVGIMGASGSGKTTLLNCVSTIDRVTAGHIIINGEDITKLKGNKLNKFRREELGFIFQDFNLLDTLTAYENIALALTIQKVKANEIDRRVNEIAEKLGITVSAVNQRIKNLSENIGTINKFIELANIIGYNVDIAFVK
jgi:predicted ABC-type transport system involved in lysophospholipase L1 biosynthesis ATPase subunit